MNVFGRQVQPRVGQLDASLLDSELLSQLKDKLFDAIKIYKPEWKDRYEDEFKLLLKLLLFKVTIWDNSTTYGGKLQNLQLAHALSTKSLRIPLSRRQKLAYGLVTIGGSFLWSKLDAYLVAASYDSADNPTIMRLRDLVDRLSVVWTGASLLNFVLFLYSGNYSTLIMRLLKMKYVTVTHTVSRVVNFEFQNRQLVWNALTEFLLFALPLVNFAKIQRKITMAIWNDRSAKGDYNFLPQKSCAVCYQRDAGVTGTFKTNAITNPYVTDCGHVYCYVCIKLELEKGDWSCLRCNKVVKRASPYVELEPQHEKTE